jgi:nucleoporin NUP82
MPKITSYTPAWLSKPNPGHEIFVPSSLGADHPSLSAGTGGKGAAKPGPRRTIAQRGTEVFVAVGREIRWADLVYLKEAWEDKQKGSGKGKSRDSQYQDDHAQGYRVSSVRACFLMTAKANTIAGYQNPSGG